MISLRSAILALSVAAAGCGGGSSSPALPVPATPTPAPTAAPATQMLFASTDRGLYAYVLPVTSSSTPTFINNTTFAIRFDANGNMAYAAGRVVGIYTAPVRASSSTPAAMIFFSGLWNSAVAFTPAGDLFASNLGFDTTSGSDDSIFGFAHPLSSPTS
ncbi:MAG TPA: hypothetical protein VK669_11375, partial [Candidatus Limnocylindrales bacterium]|nr:hypothetical protein [Candidatus Limnocylindrales bacterium]